MRPSRVLVQRKEATREPVCEDVPKVYELSIIEHWADLTNVAEQALGYETDWRKLVKLETFDRPGLTEVEFFGLFVKCEVCKLIMARQVFTYHHCSPSVVDDWVATDNEE